MSLIVAMIRRSGTHCVSPACSTGRRNRASHFFAHIPSMLNGAHLVRSPLNSRQRHGTLVRLWHTTTKCHRRCCPWDILTLRRLTWSRRRQHGIILHTFDQNAGTRIILLNSMIWAKSEHDCLWAVAGYTPYPFNGWYGFTRNVLRPDIP